MAPSPETTLAPAPGPSERETHAIARALLNDPARSEAFWIGGRLLTLSAERVSLADAFNRIELYRKENNSTGASQLPEASALAQVARAGDLVRVLVSAEENGSRLALAIELSSPGELRPSGEHARGLGERLVARSQAQRFVREYFYREQFLEVDTPFRVPSPGLDLYVDAISADNQWLITSPEHHMKRLLVAGAQRIFQIAHASRTEELGPLHQPEFLLVEWYRAYAGMQEVMRDTEALLTGLLSLLRGASSAQEPEPNAHPKPLNAFEYQGELYDLSRPFLQISVREAFQRFAGEEDVVRLARDDEDRYFQLLVDHIEPALAQLKRPIFLHGYPLSQASLARPAPDDPETAERFELYLAGVELCNGFGELSDPKLQRARYEQALRERAARNMPVYPLDEPFLTALEEGMPQAGGNALGLDRVIMLGLNEASLAHTVLFPVE